LEINRLGVFGGTYNPIHFGHLHIARQIQRLFSLSEVHFVVATIPPHKPLKDLIQFTHRYAMVSLAIAGMRSFVPSLVELTPRASAFTIDTMRKLRDRHGGKRTALYFIAGGDSLIEMKSWRRNEKLLTSYNFIFAMRPGTIFSDPEDVLPQNAITRVRDLRNTERIPTQRRIIEEETGKNRIYLVDVGAPDISSTEIRSMVSSGKSIQRKVPDSVREYIQKLHLYGGR
jgi:nicotinate-nucleotide adenylyltransferase